MLGVELVVGDGSSAPNPDLAEAVLYQALRRGLSFKTTMGNVLTLAPPLTIGETELEEALDILSAALRAAHDEVAVASA
jgi:4-aminobutyrate aminotransferase